MCKSISWIPCITLPFSWEARTRHRRCRTRVRRCGTRRRAGNTAARASGRVRPRGSHVVFTDARRREPIRLRRAPTWADSGRLGPESAGIGRYRPESTGIGRYWPKRPKQPIPAEIQKKKKNPERTVLLNTNPTSAQFRSEAIDLDDEEIGVWLSYWLSFI